jgi:integrase
MAKGQILPRSRSRWLVRVYHSRHPLKQTRTYKNTAVSGSREAAEDELAHQLALLPMRASPESSFSDYIEYWLAVAVEPCLRTKTARDYRGHLGRYALPAIGEIRLDELQPLDLQSVYSELLARHLAPRTIRYTHSIVHAALEQARVWNLIRDNPATGLALPRSEQRDFRVFTPEEARSFYAAAAVDPDGLVLLVALSTGLRPSEYLALRRRDFDRDRNTFTVDRTIERVPPRQSEGGRLELGRWKSEATKRALSRRNASIPVEVALRVGDLLDRQSELFNGRLAHRTEAETEELIFRTPGGKPIHERNLVQRVFKPLLRRSGMPDMRLYDLRHSFATLALRAGTPAKLVSEQLGHSSVAFTLDTYGHVLAETRGEVAQRLSDFIFSVQPVARDAKSEHERKPIEREAPGPKQKLA